MIALKALGIEGEVITTPFSFVATTHALTWNNLIPVFADINPNTFNLDPEKVEAAITSRTSAILPVHCYGKPSEMDRYEKIARRHHLKIIYDAAHAFGIRDSGGSILRYGNLSVLSFHATKVFNTFEGGAIVSPNAETKNYIDHLKNFGFVDEVTVVDVGINGKMNEIQAAFGLLQLKYLESSLIRRREIDALYRQSLKNVRGITILGLESKATSNFSYFPILVGDEYPLKRDDLYNHMKQQGIFARRYFYPLISDMPMYREMPSATHANLPIAARMAEQVICLPIYPTMTDTEVRFVIEVMSKDNSRQKMT